MAAQDKHIIYTAADFQRYYNGTMTETEMHALEKAALEDPFLSDALDGYAFTQTAEEDIKELAAQIPPEEKKKSAGKLFSLSSPWLRVAAMLILVAGVAFIGYELNNKNKSENIASAEKNPMPTDAIVSAKNATPVTTPPDTLTFADIKTEKEAETHHAIKPAPAAQDKTMLPEAARQEEDMNNKTIAIEKRELALSKKSVPAPKFNEFYFKPPAPGKYLLQGKITDDFGNPVSFAQISTNKNKGVATTDALGNFSLPVGDSLLLANITAVGYASINQSLNSNGLQNIVLPRNNSALQEVVVTGYGVQRQRKDVGAATATIKSSELTQSSPVTVSNALEGKVSGVNIAISGPVGGTGAYDKYIMDSVRRPFAPDSLKDIHGEVLLSFKVNKKGAPYRIRVIKSLCEVCDKEAIRLLLAGPKWVPTNGKKTSTTIRF